MADSIDDDEFKSAVVEHIRTQEARRRRWIIFFAVVAVIALLALVIPYLVGSAANPSR